MPPIVPTSAYTESEDTQRYSLLLVVATYSTVLEPVAGNAEVVE